MILSRRVGVWLIGLLLVGLFSASASAQVLEEDKESYVKKGFFFSVEYGVFFNIIKPKTLTIDQGPQAGLVGHLGGIALGFDVADRVNLHLSFLTTQTAGDSQQGGGSGTYLFNLAATFYFVRANQLYVYAKVGAGLMLVLPGGIFPGPGVMGQGGLGIRYYTRMRHLSIGIEVLGLFRIPTDDVGFTLGVGLMPTLMYTF